MDEETETPHMKQIPLKHLPERAFQPRASVFGNHGRV